MDSVLLSGLIVLLLIVVVFILSSKRTIILTDKSIELSKVMPIQCIESDLIENGNGDITAGYKVFFPEVFTISDNLSEKMQEDFQGIFKMLPIGAVVHQQTMVYESTYENDKIGDIPSYLGRASIACHVGKPILNGYCNIYITFTNRSIKRGASNTGLLRQLNHVFTQPYKGLKNRKKEIASHLLNIQNSLNAMQIEALRMNNEELNNAIYDYLEQSYDTPTQDATKEVVSPICVDDGVLKIGNKYIAVLSLAEEGATLEPTKTPKTIPSSSFNNGIDVPYLIKSKASLVYPLTYGLPVNHVLNTVIEITDSDNVINALKMEKRGLNIIASFYQPAKDKQDDIDIFCDTVTKFNYTTAYTSLSVVLSDTDKNRLDNKVSLAKLAFNNMNQSKCYVENYEAANIFFSTIPGNARSSYRGFINTTSQAINYLNKEGLYISANSGYVFCDRFGKPSVIDTINYKLLENTNFILVGPSGSGKSYNLNEMINQNHMMMHTQIIIDKGGSYRNQIMLNEGKYFEAKNINSFRFNPFLCPKDRFGNYQLLGDPDDPDTRNGHLIFIRTLLSIIWKGNGSLSQLEKVILDETIIGYYDYVNKNRIELINLIGYKDFISNHFVLDDRTKLDFDLNTFIRVLKPYTEGEHRLLFNALENIDVKNDRLIAFELEGINEDVFPLTMCLILNLIKEKIMLQGDGIRKDLIIDEALDFLKDDKMGDYIGVLYRQIRKKEGRIGIAMQKVDFIDEIAPTVKKSILANSDVKYILSHDGYKESIPLLQELLSLSDEAIASVESLQKDHETGGHKWREFLIILKTDCFIVRMELSKQATAVYDSREKYMLNLRNKFKKHRSTELAINEFIKENYDN